MLCARTPCSTSDAFAGEVAHQRSTSDPRKHRRRKERLGSLETLHRRGTAEGSRAPRLAPSSRTHRPGPNPVPNRKGYHPPSLAGRRPGRATLFRLADPPTSAIGPRSATCSGYKFSSIETCQSFLDFAYTDVCSYSYFLIIFSNYLVFANDRNVHHPDGPVAAQPPLRDPPESTGLRHLSTVAPPSPQLFVFFRRGLTSK